MYIKDMVTNSGWINFGCCARYVDINEKGRVALIAASKD